MTIGDTVHLALRNLNQAKLRTVLTVLGVSIGIAWVASSSAAAGAPSVPDIPLQLQHAEARYTVVGILERQPGPGGLPGAPSSRLMIPLAKARDISAVDAGSLQSLLREPAQGRSYGSVTVKVAGPQFTEDVENQIKEMGLLVLSSDFSVS